LRIFDLRFGIDSTDKSRGGYHQEILGHFGKGGPEGYVWFYQGKGKLLVCENDAMGLG
jgi:hypothetical protein